jgi:hypothetical protein
MNPPIFIAIPAGNTVLIEDMQRELAPYARVSDASYRDLETVKLVLDIVGQAVGIAGGVAGILTYLQATRDRARAASSKTGVVLSRPGGPTVALDDADEALLKTLLGID